LVDRVGAKTERHTRKGEPSRKAHGLQTKNIQAKSAEEKVLTAKKRQKLLPDGRRKPGPPRDPTMRKNPKEERSLIGPSQKDIVPPPDEGPYILDTIKKQLKGKENILQ